MVLQFLQFLLLEVLAVVLVLRLLLRLHLLLIYDFDVLLGAAEVGSAVGAVVLGRAHLCDVLAARRLEVIAGLVLVFILLAGRGESLVLALARLLRRLPVLLARLPVVDVVLNLVQHLLVGLDAVLVVVHVVLLTLAGPRVLADHVEIGLSGLLELLVLLEGMLLKTIDVPGQQLEHVGVFPAVLGGLAEGLLGEVDLEGGLGLGLLRGKAVHLEMI